MSYAHLDMGPAESSVTLTIKLTDMAFLFCFVGFFFQEIWRNLPTRSGWIRVYNRWYIYKEAAAKNGTPASQGFGFWPHSANHQPVPTSVYSQAWSLFQDREFSKGMNLPFS